VGNPIIAVGARTGRDGIHGATFASEDLSEESEAKRPRVQVGDPFTEKLLLEASLELINSGHIVAIQDMGAAGLTSSSAEMAARGDVGVVIDTALVPVREEGMTPYEILLSESQERMLVVAKRGHEEHVHAILAKWDLTSAVIGEVIAEPVYRVVERGRVVAEFPGSKLVSEAPVYEPPYAESPAIVALRERDVHAISELPEERDPVWTLERLLSSPTIASKAWVYRQYDSTVRTNTVIGPGGDAAVLRLRGTNKGIAVKTDCNGRYVYLEPRTGGRQAVAESARNVACTGARPMAITNCLNFGNPKKPEVFWQFREAVGGMGEACEALRTPVTGGNVSFYNESPVSAVYPTPTVGMVGLLDDISKATRSTFAVPGDTIVLLGDNTDELGGSEYLQRVHGVVAGRPPQVDLAREKALIDTLVEAIGRGFVRSAHDCADGGLAVALAEACMMVREAMLGADVDLSTWDALPLRALLFGEGQGRALLSTASEEAVLRIAQSHGCPARIIGTVRRADAPLSIRARGATISAPLPRLAAAYHDAIPTIMARPVGAGATTGEPATVAG
jgi:phosphoribosylformylglycinamidine synthase